MVLPEVHREVRDPAPMRLVVAQWAGPERAADPLHDLGGRGFDQRPHPEGTPSAALLAIVWIRVDLGRGASSAARAVCSAMSTAPR